MRQFALSLPPQRQFALCLESQRAFSCIPLSLLREEKKQNHVTRQSGRAVDTVRMYIPTLTHRELRGFVKPVKSQNLRRFVHNIPLQCALRLPTGLVPQGLADRAYKVKAQERHVQPTMMTIWCTKAQSKSFRMGSCSVASNHAAISSYVVPYLSSPHFPRCYPTALKPYHPFSHASAATYFVLVEVCSCPLHAVIQLNRVGIFPQTCKTSFLVWYWQR